jgi:hypothetical protein
MNNKHYRKSSIVRVALLLALTAFVIGLVPLFSSSALAFGVGDLNGNYGAQNSGWLFKGMPNPNATANSLIPFNTVELINFNGAGMFTGNQIVSDDGVAVPLSISGTYTVETDGRGTMTWTVNGGPKHRDFVIVNGGAELQFLQSDPAGSSVAMAGGVMIKQ